MPFPFTIFSCTYKPIVIIPTRSCQKFPKQICLWDFALIIGIISIIQIVEAINFFLKDISKVIAHIFDILLWQILSILNIAIFLTCS